MGEQLDIMYIYCHFDGTLDIFMMRKKTIQSELCPFCSVMQIVLKLC